MRTIIRGMLMWLKMSRCSIQKPKWLVFSSPDVTSGIFPSQDPSYVSKARSWVSKVCENLFNGGFDLRGLIGDHEQNTNYKQL